MLGRLATRLRDAAADRADRRAASRLRRRAAALPRDADADQVVDFLLAGHATSIAAWQVPEELRALARLVARRRPRTVLEIGTADGGTLFAHARLAHEEALIVSVDLPEGPFGGGYPAWRVPLYRSFAGPRQRLVLLREDSHAPKTAETLQDLLAGRPLEYAFIDGDHTYDGVRRDFELCARFAVRGTIVAFHDISPHPNPEWFESDDMSSEDGTAHDFWTEVKQAHPHQEFIHDPDQEGYGIGVLHFGGRREDDEGRAEGPSVPRPNRP